MPIFAYSAVDSTGRTIRSTTEAESEQMVLAKVRDQGLHLTEIKQINRMPKARVGRGRMKAKALVVFSRQFATMIQAACPKLCRKRR